MASINIDVNGEEIAFSGDPNTPLLWVLRDNSGLTGTKYCCGIGVCGACTVLRNDNPIRACITPVSSVAGVQITTIEGLSEQGDHPLQLAWVEERVSQCGYCQPGMIMTLVGLLKSNPTPSESDINFALSQNLCRCGTYFRIRRAISRAIEAGSEQS